MTEGNMDAFLEELGEESVDIESIMEDEVKETIPTLEEYRETIFPLLENSNELEVLNFITGILEDFREISAKEVL